MENHAYTDHENNIQRVSDSQLRDALDTVWIIMIRCIILSQTEVMIVTWKIFLVLQQKRFIVFLTQSLTFW